MNIKLFYAYKFFKDTIPIYPVYLFLFELKGLTLAQISFLLAIWSIPVVLLEVPTGILADYWSRKGMIIIGGFLKTACYVLWYFSEGFMLFAFGFVFWGISESFCSGSEEALLFDNLKICKREEDFDQIYGKGSFYASLGVALSCLAGGFLTAAINYEGVLLLSIFFVMISTLLASNFREINFFKMKNIDKTKNVNTKPITTLIDAVTLCIRNKMLLMIILMLVFVIGTAGILDEYDQLIVRNLGLNISLIGIWISVRYLFEGLGAKFAYLLKPLLNKLGKNRVFYFVFLLCLLAGIFLAVFSIAHRIVLIPLYGLFYMIMAAAGILQEEYVQQKIGEQGRSTVHSLISLIHNLYGIIFFIIFAFVLSYFGIQIGIVVISIYIIILSAILCILYLST